MLKGPERSFVVVLRVGWRGIMSKKCSKSNKNGAREQKMLIKASELWYIMVLKGLVWLYVA